MYNRYVPQSDGTFRRDWMPDAPPEPAASSCPPVPNPSNPQQNQSRRPPQNPQPPPAVGNFFRQLLPRDFCTEDLIVVLLLLLMSGNSKEDQNFALLTLALYLFL